MALHWIPPPLGTLKINSHGAYSAVPFPNGNNLGIGVIYMTNSGALRHVSVGVLPNLSISGNQLWAVYAPMRRAFLLGYKSVIIEMNNYEADQAIQDYNHLTPTPISGLVEQIDTLRRNEGWTCSIAFIFPARNRVARYTAKLGMEVGGMLYTMDRTIGVIEELLDWDLGLGVDHPDYMDVYLMTEEADPINFDVAVTLADNAENLGLGQVNAPKVVVIDMEDAEDGLVGVVEQTLIPAALDGGFLFVNEPPLEDID